MSVFFPRAGPQNYYRVGEQVELKLNRLESVKSRILDDYNSLGFCQPSSVYSLKMRTPESCKVLCRKMYNEAELQHFAKKVEEESRINWSVDNVPASTKYSLETATSSGYREHKVYYEKGFPLGFIGAPAYVGSEPGVKYINNHVRITIQYHEEKLKLQNEGENTISSIVGFEVEPSSIKHKIVNESVEACPRNTPLPTTFDPQPVSDLNLKNGHYEEIIWTYDVFWEPVDDDGLQNYPRKFRKNQKSILHTHALL